ncbi:hypothetical protein GCM10007320_28510 [Pseudorhodoferax aquiterrae]|uniref:Fimbrial assembly protein n=1 Tax=Pseudorhodoferax aquiterrae TaxID=747304 RepID=A0ABQ3G2T1_9BURK|nr:PilN domain-containing protein [Pseudorhodoferax aquiterrae]GHC84240.1 hypothetical protein GCM10007320_28510 [Pseudorhodoferax aquiterrae]
MPSVSRDLRLFGLDLGALWAALRRPWEAAPGWPIVSWLAPDQPVRVVRADAPDAFWQGARGRMAQPPAGAPSTVAVALPQAMVLQRTVVLPRAAATEAAHALALQVQGWNPFPAQDLVWGWRRRSTAGGGIAADVALASRKQVASHLESLATRLESAAAVPEIWVAPDDGPPIVLPDYGEGRRAAAARRHWRLCRALLVLAVLLALLLALTPSLQLWLREAQAARAHAELAAQARPVLARREALVQAQEAMAAAAKLLDQRIDPLRVLELLTQALPDGTAVQSLRLQGDVVTLSGTTGDAASLMQGLGRQAGLRNVRAPAAATRQPGAAFESFTVSFQLDPAAFALASRGGPAPAAATAADGGGR